MLTGLDWSVIIGIAIGMGGPVMTGVVLLIRMENRVTTLERGQEADAEWRARVAAKLDLIAQDVNRLIGARNHESP